MATRGLVASRGYISPTGPELKPPVGKQVFTKRSSATSLRVDHLPKQPLQSVHTFCYQFFSLHSLSGSMCLTAASSKERSLGGSEGQIDSWKARAPNGWLIIPVPIE